MKLKQIGSNQTELHLNNGTIVLFSYETPVAAGIEFNNGTVEKYIKTNQKYSITTTKHINSWLKAEQMVDEVNQSVLDALVGEYSNRKALIGDLAIAQEGGAT